MKIKVKPEDFIVEEKADLKFYKGGDHKVYLLTKKGFNTADLLLILAKRLNIPHSNFSYGGKKDRHALTTQHITIKDKRVFDINEDSFSLKLIGDMQRPMTAECIIGNKFKIIVRDLDEAEAERATGEIGLVKEHGLINYFDDQRFGSYDRKHGFIGEKIIQNNHNLALRIYMTNIHPEDKTTEKQRKRFFYDNWGNWQECLTMAKTAYEKRSFRMLENKEERPYQNCIMMIPKEELSLYFSAFQSYLWNNLAERILKTYHGASLLTFKGAYWDYMFYRALQKNNAGYLKELVLPTASHNAIMPDNLTETLYKEILDEHQLQPASFVLRRIKTAFFKSSPRSLIMTPKINNSSIEDDELYAGKKKLLLDFELLRGSYATMLIKRLMAWL